MLDDSSTIQDLAKSVYNSLIKNAIDTVRLAGEFWGRMKHLARTRDVKGMAKRKNPQIPERRPRGASSVLKSLTDDESGFVSSLAEEKSGSGGGKSIIYSDLKESSEEL